MARSKTESERAGDVLANSLKRLELGARLHEYRVWPVWNETVGKPIARNAQPEKIRNGTLFVKVTSPVWMQQLQYMKEMIAEKLNQRLNADTVKNIFFVVGRIDEDAVDEDSPAAAADTVSPTPTGDLDESFLDEIKDPATKQAFKKLLRSYSRRKHGAAKTRE
jgi:hypothetical protein